MSRDEIKAEGDSPAPTRSVDAEGAPSLLDRPIQEHIGKELRSTYNVMTDKPAFLGDPVIPPHLDSLVQKLEARDRQRIETIHDRAVAAVEGALEGTLAPAEPNKL